MDPITGLAIIGIVSGFAVIVSALKKERSPKRRMKRSRGKALREARNASKKYKKNVRKTIRR